MNRLHIIILLGVLFMTNINAKEKEIEKQGYQINVEGKNLFWEFGINGQTISHNRIRLSGNNPKLTTQDIYPHSIYYFENGENEIVLEIGAVNWFNEDIEFIEEKNRFDKEGYINFSLIKNSNLTNFSIIENDDPNKDVIATISVFVDENGKLATKEGDVEITKYIHKGVEEDHAHRIFWTHNTYPENMTIYRFTKKISISRFQKIAWEDAEIYTNTKEQREELEKAYQELWDALNNKDFATIKKKTKLFSLWDLIANEKGITHDEAIDLYFNESVLNFDLVPIDFKDYDVVIMNNGKTVSLVNKTIPTLTPIILGGRDFLMDFGVVFSLIDGEFFVVR